MNKRVLQVAFEYIEVFYNRIRRHAKIGNLVPLISLTSFTPAGNNLRHHPDDLPVYLIGPSSLSTHINSNDCPIRQAHTPNVYSRAIITPPTLLARKPASDKPN